MFFLSPINLLRIIMTLEQLKMLKLVAEQGSLKGASEILFKTQPAISQGIKQLENQLGLTLFSREGYRLILTKEGQQIYQRASRLLNEADEIKQLSKFIVQGNESTITLAIEASFDFNKILPILEMTQNEFPHTQIILKQEYISGAFESVLLAEADLAITTVDEKILLTDKFEAKPIYQGNLVNVVSPRLLARHPKLSLVEELRNEYQIVVQDSGKTSKGVSFSVQTGQRCWYVNDFHTKKILIMSGMGWGRLPEYIVKDELKQQSLIVLTLDNVKTRVTLNYQALKLKSKLLGPVALKLWHNIQQYYLNECPSNNTSRQN